MVCAKRDVRGAVAALHDLARFLERLIPSDDDMDLLMRSRDFASGFKAREQRERELETAVLEALATRPADAQYEPLRIEGYAVEAVESAIHALWKRGLVDAHSGKPAQVLPAALTSRGFQELEKRTQALVEKGGAK
jgi:hypothetical protein